MWICFTLGCLVSLSPCPLTSNILAVGYVAKTQGAVQLSLCAVLYTIGRCISYAALALLLAMGLSKAPTVSYALQEYMPLYIGPILILAGLVILEIMRLPTFGKMPGAAMASRMKSLGLWGAIPLGMLFALAMCPPSAAIFFGSVLPISLQGSAQDFVMSVSFFGCGTSLPVLFLAPLALLPRVKRFSQRLSAIQKYIRILTGSGFLLFGLYLTLRYFILY